MEQAYDAKKVRLVHRCYVGDTELEDVLEPLVLDLIERDEAFSGPHQKVACLSGRGVEIGRQPALFFWGRRAPPPSLTNIPIAGVGIFHSTSCKVSSSPIARRHANGRVELVCHTFGSNRSQ